MVRCIEDRRLDAAHRVLVRCAVPATRFLAAQRFRDLSALVICSVSLDRDERIMYAFAYPYEEEGMRRRRFGIGVVCATAALAIGACGDDDDSADGTAEGGETTTLKVSYVPYVGAAPFILGIENGFFEERGLEIEDSQGPAPAPIMAQVVSGQLDIGFTTIPALISAVAGGAPLQAISPFDGIIDPESPQVAILVNADSGIASPKDLEDKKVGVVALQSELDVLLHEVVRRDGGDPEAVESVQIPFPEMNAALKANRVDAVVNTEPFVTLSEEEGDFEAISYPEVEVVPNQPVTAFVASTEFIESNPEVVEQFRAAMEESLDYAAENTGEAQDTMTEVGDIEPDLLRDINLGLIFEPVLDEEAIEIFTTLMEDFGFVEDPPPASELLAQGG
jgi:ABC-type nitrate/sulfonate/bicarbonate transport system substrate-binding protein